jgi:hypothetical protein
MRPDKLLALADEVIERGAAFIKVEVPIAS